MNFFDMATITELPILSLFTTYRQFSAGARHEISDCQEEHDIADELAAR